MNEMMRMPRTFLTLFALFMMFALPVIGADFQKGLDAAKRGDFATALKEWKPLAELGNADAQYNLGIMYDKGRGVLQNYKIAVKWYTLAAKQGLASAQFNLGVRYDNGQGVLQNYKTAVKWYTLAAKQGHASAQYNVGVMYDQGLGVLKDYKTAVKWYNLAAKQGDISAQYNLGGMYDNGRGVLQNKKTAMEWYTLAAKQGHASAQYNLGVKYARGQGVLQNYKAAVKWYTLAAKQGHASGQHNLGVMYDLGQQLDEVGFVWHPRAILWEEGFAALLIFKEREGHCKVPQRHKEGDYRLGQWINVQRLEKDGISPERLQRLDEVGFVWDVLAAAWEEGFAALVHFKEREGHCTVPSTHKEGDYRLGQWIGVQRLEEDGLSPERRQRLDEVGFVWDVLATAWEEGFAALLIFKEREGHCKVPAIHKEGDYNLGQWVNGQRSKKDGPSPERRQRLDDVGFVWDVLAAAWEEGFAALVRFKEREGHCNVSKSHKEDDYNLGQWISVRRSRKDTLSPERRQRLDEVGFVWDPHTILWEEGFAALLIFKEREGHCKVPQRHKEGDHRLGPWVSNQRNKKDALSPERRQRLDRIGFNWGTKKSVSPKA
jgi:TPR repeat protein